jgi:purine-cytosine permease-like protein
MKNKKKTAAIYAALSVISMKTALAAGDFGNSKIAEGVKNLITDITKWLLIISPIATVLFVIYYLIRKGMADEMEHKKWNSRIVTAVICGIGAVIASVTLNMLIAYFK